MKQYDELPIRKRVEHAIKWHAYLSDESTQSLLDKIESAYKPILDVKDAEIERLKSKIASLKLRGSS